MALHPHFSGSLYEPLIPEQRWIATDLGKFGVHTTRKRLIGVQRELKSSGNPFRAFEVLRDLILRAHRAELGGRVGDASLPGRDGSPSRPFGDEFFHGIKAGRLVVGGPINLPVGRLFIDEVITECRKRGASRADILAFEFEMGLFPAVLDESKRKGIDLAPKTIPPEVFDKRAVDKGQVRFADVAYIEAAPRYDKKDKLTVAIELTDFSVYCRQGFVDSVEGELKAGKSEVVCQAAKLIKISKDRNDILTREVLTKQWTDWVDYWAVDFDYESRKGIVKIPINFGQGEPRMNSDGHGSKPASVIRVNPSSSVVSVVHADGQFIDFEE